MRKKAHNLSRQTEGILVSLHWKEGQEKQIRGVHIGETKHRKWATQKGCSAFCSLFRSRSLTLCFALPHKLIHNLTLRWILITTSPTQWPDHTCKTNLHTTPVACLKNYRRCCTAVLNTDPIHQMLISTRSSTHLYALCAVIRPDQVHTTDGSDQRCNGEVDSSAMQGGRQTT